MIDKLIRGAVNRYGYYAKGAYENSDLLQMAYEEFYKSKYDPEKAKLSTFVYLITMRAIKNTFRYEDEYEYLVMEPFTKHEYDELPGLLRDLFAMLEIDEYYVIKKHFYEGFGTKEIAKLMDVSDGRVSQIKKEALNKLATMFKLKGINEKNYRDYITYN
jgi:RNA polymerase sigma factor (sigma-70 family)